jgi:hypothetical protein
MALPTTAVKALVSPDARPRQFVRPGRGSPSVLGET